MSVRMESQEGTSRAAESKPHPYDVFINHRGPDVKKTFVSHLDAALVGVGLRPFLDAKDIKLCRDVNNSINEALKGANVHVAIFSERCAESKYCLNELCDMLKTGKKILPVFYHVDPGDLSMIKNSPFKEGFTKLIERETELTEGQVEKWKDALSKISGSMGLRLDEVNGNEAELVRRILREVRRLMPIVLPDPVNRDQQDRRLNVLVLGYSKVVEDIVHKFCGADRHTQFQGHIENCGLTESRNSWPPIYLYGDTDGMNGNDLTNRKTFVKARNEMWHRRKVESCWSSEVYRRSPRERPDRTLRLHMVWVVCILGGSTR